MSPKAFRCKRCGHLEHAGHAGDNDLPLSCSVCGAGVIFSPKLQEAMKELAQESCTYERRLALVTEMMKLKESGTDVRTLDPSNWEVLADCHHDRLAELGLKAEHVVRHQGKSKKVPDGKIISVAAIDTPVSADIAG